MIDDLYMTEGLHSVMARGMCEDYHRDYIHAHGASGHRNPLGNALNHLLVHPNERNAQVVINYLAKTLVRLEICKERDSVDIANDAAKFWLTWHCPYCKGTGVINAEQQQCPVCQGTGKKQEPSDERVRRAIKTIETYHEWMEAQLRRRLA